MAAKAESAADQRSQLLIEMRSLMNEVMRTKDTKSEGEDEKGQQ